MRGLFGFDLFQYGTNNNEEPHQISFSVTRLKNDNSKTLLSLEFDKLRKRLRLRRGRNPTSGGRGSDLNGIKRVQRSNVDCVRLILQWQFDQPWDFLFDGKEDLDQFISLLISHLPSIEVETASMVRPVEWVNDSNVNNCNRCGERFNLINRKHHCRNCGQVVCRECSDSEAIIPRFGIQTPVRVCKQCYSDILTGRIGQTFGLMEAYGSSNKFASSEVGDFFSLEEPVDDGRRRTPSRAESQKRLSRKRKWEEFLATNETIENNDIRVVKLCRDGIPPEHRGSLWSHLSGARKKKAILEEKKPYYYKQLLEYANQNPGSYLNTMEKDLDRTTPIHSIYKEEVATSMLRRILTAYGVRNTNVGYCQSMNFVGALLLLFSEEEPAFWLLCTLVEEITNVNGYHYHQADLAGVHIDECVFSDLVQEYLPEVYENIESLRVPLLPLTVNWFLCIFVNSLPLEITLRVWDILFCEGATILFRAGLALLKLHENVLAGCQNFEDVLQTLKKTCDITVTGDEFIHMCYDPRFENISEKIPQRRAFHETHVQQLIREEDNDEIRRGRSHSQASMNSLHYHDGFLSAQMDENEVETAHVSSLLTFTGRPDLDARMVHLDPNYSQRFKKFAQYFGNIEINQDVISEYFTEDKDTTPSPPNSLHSTTSSFYHFTNSAIDNFDDHDSELRDENQFIVRDVL